MNNQWLTGPIENLRDTLARVAEFQQFVGVTSFDAARARIHKHQSDDHDTQDNLIDPMPRATIGSNGGRTRTKRSTTGWITSGGGLFLLLEREFAPTIKEGDAVDSFLIDVESILDGLERIAGTDTNLNLIAIAEATPALVGNEDYNRGQPFVWQEFDLTAAG